MMYNNVCYRQLFKQYIIIIIHSKIIQKLFYFNNILSNSMFLPKKNNNMV